MNLRLSVKVALGLAVLGTLAVVLLFVKMQSLRPQASDLKPPSASVPSLPPSPPIPLDTEGTEDKSDFIRLFDLKPGDVVSSPLVIEGEARTWYFEGSFPVTLEDGNGKILAGRHAEAQGDWMTAEFVPFKAMLLFGQPTSPTGTLIFRKDNPSGLPEHDDEFRILVRFKKP